jgi:hypothetical protein
MSEKIYAWLLRLYPSRFRETYSDDALQLFRDRSRDEKGLVLSLRLWLDLFADLAVSVPREYFYAEPELVAASAQHPFNGTPLFYVLRDESLRPGALVLGSMLSLGALVTFSILLSQGSYHRPLSASSRQLQSAAYRSSSESGHPVRQAANDANFSAGGEHETIASTSQQPTTAATPARPINATPRDSQSNVLLAPNNSLRPQSATPQPLDAATPIPTDTSPTQPDAAPVTAAAVRNANLDAAERQRVIDGAAANLKEHYIYPDIAQKMAEALLVHEKAGDYDGITDGAAFAALLTSQLRNVSHDPHLDVVYSRVPLPEHPTGQTPEGLARYRKAMEQENCMFEKVEILPHNIGYLKLNFFGDTSVCLSTATAAMASLNHVDTIIFDLRDNRGGYQSMVMLITDYLFDHPEYMYSPRENTTERSWTRSPVPGNRLADKPVYVLTSARTFSGAEHFSYNLKMLKRGTLVGETTGGASDVGIFHRIDIHFGMSIRETRGINPYSQPDWAVTGVEPDVKVKAADALETAVKLAESRLLKK